MDFFADTLGCFITHESESQCSTIVLNSHKRILNYLLLCSKKTKKSHTGLELLEVRKWSYTWIWENYLFI